MLIRYITALLGLFILLGLSWIGGNSLITNHIPDTAYYIVGVFVVGVLSGPEGILAILQFRNKNDKGGNTIS